jgi:hypothetical protein
VNDDKMLARIRGLLAKAEATTFEAEAEAYRSKAAALAMRYNVDTALLDAKRGRLNGSAVASFEVKFAGTYTMEKRDLFLSIAHPLGLKTRSTIRRGRAFSSTAYGFPAELELLEVLYTSLLLQSDRELRRAQRPIFDDVSTVTWKRSWLMGFNDLVMRRLRRFRQDEVAEHAKAGTGAELVLADRAALVKQRYQEMFPGQKTLPPRRISLDGQGYRQGEAAGKRADLGGSKLDTGRRGALGGGR